METWDGLCLNCKKVVPAKKLRQKYRSCSVSCAAILRKKRRARSYREINAEPTVSKPTAGAINELRVACDLLLRGYAVFKALSPACPCDFAVLKNGNLYRIEVTGAAISGGGKLMYAPHNPKNYDFLAIVKRNGEITYVPDLPALSPG